MKRLKSGINSGNATLKEIALQAFKRDELEYNFKEVITFEKAYKVLDISYLENLNLANQIGTISRASTAMFKLNIIRKALNLGQDLHLTKDSKDAHIYYPYNPFVITGSTYYKNEIKSGKFWVIGKIKSKGIVYYVLSGDVSTCGYAGLGYFNSDTGVGHALATIGFLGCANEEIAQHFGKYFGMLITEAKYGDMVDFEIVSGY